MIKRARAGTKYATRILLKVLLILFIVAIVIAYLYIQNNCVILSKVIYENNKIPKTFVGYNILHISDICNKPLNTLEVTKSANPDLVIITGNFTDQNGDYSKSVELVQSLSEEYKVLFVLGEFDNPDLSPILVTAGAEDIGNSYIEIESPKLDTDSFISEYIDGRIIRMAESGDSEAQKYIEYVKYEISENTDSSIIISGLNLMDSDTDIIDYVYNYISLEKDKFQVLAFNQSQYIDEISVVDIDLGLTGNTFGTDRFNNGYTSGIYSVNGRAMVVSSGVNKNSSNKFRLLNFPSIRLITLSDGTISKETPLEKLLGYFIDDVKTKFDTDSKFQEYKYEFS